VDQGENQGARTIFQAVPPLAAGTRRPRFLCSAADAQNRHRISLLSQPKPIITYYLRFLLDNQHRYRLVPLTHRSDLGALIGSSQEAEASFYSHLQLPAPP
jgi:hypothetical protein